MAVHKAKRSNPLAQPQRRHNSQPNDPHQKTELLDTLRHLNRGFGIALAALDRLAAGTKKDRLAVGTNKARLQKPGIFPHDSLHNYRSRTEELRALANRDLLRFFAGHEDQDAERFGRLHDQLERHL